MPEDKRFIFRSESWRRYLARQEATVFPRLVTPRGLAALWLGLALVMAASLAILSTEAPVYSDGRAIAITRGVGGAGVFAVLAPEPPQYFSYGSAARVELSQNRPPIIASVVEVEKAQIGLSEASARFGLPAEAFSTIRFPASVIFARPMAGAQDMPRPGDRNVVYQARVRSGSQRAILRIFR